MGLLTLVLGKHVKKNIDSGTRGEGGWWGVGGLASSGEKSL